MEWPGFQLDTSLIFAHHLGRTHGEQAACNYGCGCAWLVTSVALTNVKVTAVSGSQEDVCNAMLGEYCTSDVLVALNNECATLPCEPGSAMIPWTLAELCASGVCGLQPSPGDYETECQNVLGSLCVPEVLDALTAFCSVYYCSPDVVNDLLVGYSDVCASLACRHEGDTNKDVGDVSIMMQDTDICEATNQAHNCQMIADELQELEDQLADLVVLLEDIRSDTYEESESVPSSYSPNNAQTLVTETGAGVWTLALPVESPRGNPAGFEDFVSIPLKFADQGRVHQPASYDGSNPWVVSDEDAEISIPPEVDESTDRWNECFVLRGMFMASTTFGLGAAPLVVGLAFASYDACKAAAENSAGYWLAFGKYIICWGCAEDSRYYSESSPDPDVISISATATVDEPEKEEPDFQNADSNGYYEQRGIYQQMDYDARAAAWAAHNQFMLQEGAGSAEIAVEIPLVTKTLEETARLLELVTPENDFGFFVNVDTQELVLACVIPCPDSGLVSISSPGQSKLAPGSQSVPFDFTGDPGAAVVSILGITLEGFTLSAELEGGGMLPDA